MIKDKLIDFFKKPKNPYTPSNKSSGPFLERLKLTLSKISGAFMLPIAVMAIAGLFLGVGAAIESQNPIVGNLGNAYIEGKQYTFASLQANRFGSFIRSLGEPTFAALPLLFAAGFVVAFTEEAGVAVFASIIGYLVFLAIQNTFIFPKFSGNDIVGYDVLFFDSVSRDPVKLKQIVSSTLGIRSLQTSVFGGLLVGLVVAWAYNRFHKIQLPSVFSFFGGKRFVSLAVILLMIPLSFSFLIFWPWIGIFLNIFGTATGKIPYGFESFIFGYIERSLIPFGLHHVFYAPLWYTSAGGDFTEAVNNFKNEGNTLTGSILETFNSGVLAGKVGDSTLSVSVVGLPYNTATWTNSSGTHSAPLFKFFADQLHIKLGRYLQGKYVFMQFGLPAAAAAMIFAAPKENRKLAISTVVPSAITSFVTGVTEPIEFTFLFLSPFLFWGFHAFMCALAFLLMNVLGAHIAQTFSGGFIDLVIYGMIPFAKGTQLWWWFVIGVFYVPIYFFFFFFWIKFKNLKTPGRGDAVKLYTKSDWKQRFFKKTNAVAVQTVDDNQNMQMHVAMTDMMNEENPSEFINVATNAPAYDGEIEGIIDGFGGWDNIVAFNNCASRLRYDVLDKTKVDETKLKAYGVIAVRWVGENHVQAIIGPKAEQLNMRIKTHKSEMEKAQKA